MSPISVDPRLDERLRVHEHAAGPRRVERVGVLIAPVVVGHVAGDAGDPGCGHGRRHLGLAGGALVVHRGDDAGLVDLPHAGHRLVEVGAVVAGVDLDARAVGPTAGVERRRRMPRGRSPGPRARPPATRTRSSGRSSAAASPRRTARRPTGRWPRSRSRRRPSGWSPRRRRFLRPRRHWHRLRPTGQSQRPALRDGQCSSTSLFPLRSAHADAGETVHHREHRSTYFTRSREEDDVEMGFGGGVAFRDHIQ